jgi:hypothetical protein
MTHRPTIDFSTESRRTAREYAQAAMSRILEPQHNKILQQVVRGSATVDAYALNEALTAAMRACATRFGQSMMRRDATRKVAYLAHITQAVLENHADGLPVYEPGARSRKIETLEGEVAALQRAGVQSLAADLVAERNRVADLIREKTDLENRVNGAVNEATTEINGLLEKLSGEQGVNRALTATLAYALGLMSEGDDLSLPSMVLGFMDAHGIEIDGD